MPGVPLRHDRPRVYLDWSHLTRAACPTSESDRRLRNAIERTSEGANLVFSDWHFLELLDHGDRNRVLQAAAWLDSMPHVWLICDRERVSTFEGVQCLLRVAGLGRRPDSEIFTPSVTVALAGKSSIDVQSEVLGKTIQELAAGIHGHARPAMNRLKATAVTGFEQFRKDEPVRKATLGTGIRRDRWSDEQFLEHPVAESLRQAWTDLQRSGVTTCSVEDALEDLRVSHDFGDFRSLRLRDLVLRVIADHIQSVALEGSLAMDQEHLVGAAYCDIFTCDRMMKSKLDRVRSLWQIPMAATWLAGAAEATANALDEFIGRWKGGVTA